MVQRMNILQIPSNTRYHHSSFEFIILVVHGPENEHSYKYMATTVIQFPGFHDIKEGVFESVWITIVSLDKTNFKNNEINITFQVA